MEKAKNFSNVDLKKNMIHRISGLERILLTTHQI